MDWFQVPWTEKFYIKLIPWRCAPNSPQVSNSLCEKKLNTTGFMLIWIWKKSQSISKFVFETCESKSQTRMSKFLWNILPNFRLQLKFLLSTFSPIHPPRKLFSRSLLQNLFRLRNASFNVFCNSLLHIRLLFFPFFPLSHS